MNTKLNRIKKLEKIFKTNALDLPKYYSLGNGKYLFIPSGKQGVKVIVEYIYEDSYTESPLTLEELQKEYPNIVDNTEKINSIVKDIEQDNNI